ncbi:hypothetical protein EDD16DRAFT_1486159, partial [Pisolithus croceorrhizus]
PEDAEWQHVGRLVTNREYQRALDHLEGLVVPWIFELLKMNRAGMGMYSYSQLKHSLLTALQAQSLAIRTGLDRSNMAACMMNPPRHQLHWDKVIEYTFLSEFNLLRDS